MNRPLLILALTSSVVATAVSPARTDLSSLKNDFNSPEAKKLTLDEFADYPAIDLRGVCANSTVEEQGGYHRDQAPKWTGEEAQTVLRLEKNRH